MRNALQGQAMLQLTGVSKTYDGGAALQPTNLTIPDGETTVLIGPSGSGKSTLLRLMIGLIAPDTGSVRFQNTPLTPDNVLALRRRMGYVVQDGGLFPHLTAYENVALMGRYMGWEAKRIDERLQELTALTQFPAEGLGRRGKRRRIQHRFQSQDRKHPHPVRSGHLPGHAAGDHRYRNGRQRRHDGALG